MSEVKVVSVDGDQASRIQKVLAELAQLSDTEKFIVAGAVLEDLAISDPEFLARVFMQGYWDRALGAESPIRNLVAITENSYYLAALKLKFDEQGIDIFQLSNEEFERLINPPVVQNQVGEA